MPLSKSVCIVEEAQHNVLNNRFIFVLLMVVRNSYKLSLCVFIKIWWTFFKITYAK